MTDPGVPMLRTGDLVRVNFTKWDARQHWRSTCRFLGSDAYGVWLAIATGTEETRPGAHFAHDRPGVRLIPNAGYIATFYALPADLRRLHTYVDIATVPKWSLNNGTVTVDAVDLDLDVVKLHDGRVYIDDEDEFAEHRVSMSYPRSVVQQTEETCMQVLNAVTDEQSPFNSVAQQWLSQVGSLNSQ